MTKEGYKSVIVSEDTYRKLSQIAKTKGVSLCKALTEIVGEFMEKEGSQIVRG